MRSDSVYGDLLYLDQTYVSSRSSTYATLTYKYKVRDQIPEVMYQPGYNPNGWNTACPKNNDPYHPLHCASESGAYDEIIKYWTQAFPTCQMLEHSLIGAYQDPYNSIASVSNGDGSYHGEIRFGSKRVRRVMQCPGQSGPNISESDSISKNISFRCASNFSPITDGTNAPPNVSVPYLCRASGPFPSITGRLKQVASCPANSQPCHPSTTDKSRTEIDFEFAGRPFARYYHSLKQVVDKTGFPAGWTHTYSERRIDSSWINTSDGYYESLTSLGNDRYRLDNSNDRILEKVTDGTASYRIVSANGEIRYFGSTGLLLRIQNPSDPSRDVTLVYNNDVPGEEFIDHIVDSKGRTLDFKYEIPGLLTKAVLPDGTTVTYVYDSYDNLVAVDYGDGVRKEYFYHESGLADPVFRNHLTGIAYEDGQRYASFGYDNTGRVKSSQLHGPNGYVEQTTLSYDTADKVSAITPSGSTRTYTIQPGIYRRPLSITGGPDAVTNTYETDGRVKTRTYANGATSSFTYQPAYQSGTTEAVGTISERKTTVTRDAGNRLTRRELYGLQNGVQTLQQVELRTYDTNGRETASCLVDPAISGAASYVCGSQANAPNGVRQTRTTYCEAADISAGTCPIAGLVTAVDGPRIDVADITTYTYYASDSPDCATAPTTCQYRKGDLWKVTNALNHATETLRYDSAGRPLSVKDVNGVVTDLEYHPRGWLTARKVRGTDEASEDDDLITRIEYWPTGLIKQVTQPDSTSIKYTYDAARRLTDITDNAGNTIHYTLDNAGNRIQEDTKDAGGTLRRTLSRIYNQLNQLQIAKDADNHATGFTYDANGNPDTTTDALSRLTDNDHDPLNRLTRTLQDVGGINAETKFAYSALDNLTKVTDPKGLETAYTYNGLSDLTRLASPDTGITNYTYDNAGNRKTQTDARGVITTYNYDVLNRLIGITYPDISLNVGYTYDTTNFVCANDENFATGQLSRMTDASGSTDYCYDRFGRLTRKVQTTNSKAFTLRYAYTKTGQLQSITYPDGALVDYVRNALGQISEIGVERPQQMRQVLLNQTTYAPFGPATGWTYGNGRSLIRTLNQNYQPEMIRDNAAGGLSLHYSFDAVGNLTQLNNADQTAILSRYDYDALNRLTNTKDGPTGTVIEHYDYDATGNRTGLTNTSDIASYTYPSDSHRLSGTGVVARTYDPSGNTLSIGGTTKEFTYNGANRMTQVKANGVVAMNYFYNGRGEQVRKSLGTSNTYVIYDEVGRWLGDYDKNSTATQQAIWLDGLPIGSLSGSGAVQALHYLEPDHLGTPRAAIDVTHNTAVWTWDIKGEAFGNTVPNENPDGDATQFKLDMRFPGQLYDVASGLNQNWHRDYDPDTGRYIESDPIGLNGGISTYAYVSNTPLSAVDPRGLAMSPARECGGGPGTYAWAHCGDPPSGSHASGYYGGEFHAIVGFGLTSVTCNDQCGKKKTFSYLKLCIGGALGGSGGGGVVFGMDGENCNPDRYKGWFYEAGVSYGYGSAGFDIGYNNDGSLSGVTEESLGVGFGAKIKSTWCYYFPLIN